MAPAPVLVNLSRTLVAAGPGAGALRDAAERANTEIDARLCPASR
jgi:hypothetical protein